MTRDSSVLLGLVFGLLSLEAEAYEYGQHYDNTSCLLWQGDGCESIREEKLCVNSRDGMAHDLFGSLRLGKPCAWHKSGVCARVDDWTRKLEDPSDYTVAKCKEGATIDDTIAMVTPPAASQSQFSSDARAHMPWSKVELTPMDGGEDRACRGVMQIQTGHVARLFNVWTAQNLDDCKALCTNRCKGVEFQAKNKYCEVWYGDILFSTRNPGFECYARKDQDEAAKLAMVRPQDQSCLRAEPKGCAALKDRFSCLSSKDASGNGDVFGLKVHDEPCVWCGGGLCHTGGSSMCEPFDFLLRGEGKDHAFGSFTASGTFETPSCEEGQAAVFAQTDTWWQPEPPLQAELAKLSPVVGGCASIQDMATCLSSKDGSSNATWGYTPYKVKGEACVWCGGVPCTDASTSLCMPFDLVMNGQGPHHNTFYAKHSFKVATIKESENVVGADVEVQCLSGDNAGCGTLTDAFKCLASVDGRPNATIFGRKVKGQPCVWCNGRNCNSAGSLCEAYDLQMNGEGSVFVTSFDKNPMVAQCEGGMVKAHPHVHSAVLDLPAPKMDDLGCLTVHPAGCMAITDKLGCLSSIDGSVDASFGGFKIRGQPCVWCGGTSCTDGGSFKCAPFDYLTKGATKVFPHVTAVSATVAQCHAESRTFPEQELACLKTAETGCNYIRDMETCVSSKEGRPYEFIAGFKVKGQPCVWCGGGQCNTGSPNLCEPYEYAVNGAGHAFATQLSTALYSRASCDKDGQPGAVQLPSHMEVHGYHQAVQCGHPNPMWMKVGKTCGFCKVLVPSIKEQFASCAEYCTSQGGLKCKSAAFGDLGSCDVKQPASCETDFPVHRHAICECEPSTSALKETNEAFAQAVARPEADTNQHCLNSVATGCGSITDKLICLSSVDGSPNATYRGTKIAGQPCAWCGGVACTSHDPSVKCVALDFLVNGQGPAYATRHVTALTVDVAGCDKSESTRNFGDVSCLKRKENGCNTIQDKETCLSSKDGRPYTQVAGLKVEGQPCVWCGGVPCTTNNANLCEPYEFVTHGEGHAYDINNELNFYSAACEDGKAVQDHHLGTAIAHVGVTRVVDCGNPNPLWRGVSRTCGACQVIVAPEAATSYRSCEGYCQAQGGLACKKAFKASLHSCDVGTEMSCAAEFTSALSPLCECAAPEKQPPPDGIQQLNGQCGGLDWKGYVKCQTGTVCKFVTEYYSQCQLPRAASQANPTEGTGNIDDDVLGVEVAEAGAGEAIGPAHGASAGPTVVVPVAPKSNTAVVPVVAPVVAPSVKTAELPTPAKPAELPTPLTPAVAPATQTAATPTLAGPEIAAPATPTLGAAEPASFGTPTLELSTPQPLSPAAADTPGTPADADAKDTKAVHIDVAGPSASNVPAVPAATVAAVVAPVAQVVSGGTAAGTVTPAGTVNSAGTVTPAGTATPATGTATAGTETPTGAVTPAGTATPGGTVTPAGPAGTLAPANTAGADTPTGALTPANTATPAGTVTPTNIATAGTETPAPAGTATPAGMVTPAGTVTDSAAKDADAAHIEVVNPSAASVPAVPAAAVAAVVAPVVSVVSGGTATPANTEASAGDQTAAGAVPSAGTESSAGTGVSVPTIPPVATVAPLGPVATVAPLATISPTGSSPTLAKDASSLALFLCVCVCVCSCLLNGVCSFQALLRLFTFRPIVHSVDAR